MKIRKVTMCVATVIAVMCIFPIIGCSPKAQTPTEKPSESATERNYNIPLSVGYTVELADDGYYYVNLDDLEYYKRQSPDSVPAIYGASLNEIEKRLTENALTEEDKIHCAKFADDDGRSKVCNFNEMYVPLLPDNMVLSSVSIGNGGASCEYLISLAELSNGDVEHSEYSPNGMAIKLLNEEDHRAMYDSFLALVESYSNDCSGSYTLRASAKTAEVLYFGTDEAECSFAIFFTEGGAKYCAVIWNNGGERVGAPSDEWILSIGIEKYISE